jgi:hypothetical protein
MHGSVARDGSIVTPAEWLQAIERARSGEPDHLAQLVIAAASVPQEALPDIGFHLLAPPRRRRMRRLDAWRAGQLRAYYILQTVCRRPPMLASIVLDEMQHATGIPVDTLRDIVEAKKAYSKP